MSLLAIRCLHLDAVWWLVSPQNPLKPKKGMAPLKARLATARAVASHPRLVATDIETDLGTVYTAETLIALRSLFPKLQFIWLMGADNLSQIDQWEAWEQIFHTVPIAVFARPSYSVKALSAKAAHRFQRFRLRERQASRLGYGRLPSWVFLHTRLHPASASLIRAAAEHKAGKHKKGREARFRGRIT